MLVICINAELNFSYTLHLLANYSDVFLTGLNPPPHVYLISPWSPLLPADDPDYYPSYFNWIPTPLIATQHYTVSLEIDPYPEPLKCNISDVQLPGLMKAGEQAYNTWTIGQKAWTAARSWMKGWSDSSAPTTGQEISGASEKSQDIVEKEAVPDAPPVPENADHGEGGAEKKPLWGPTRCCISCVSHIPLIAHSKSKDADDVAGDRVLSRREL